MWLSSVLLYFILILKITIDKLAAEIPLCCVEHPRQATACLAVFSLPDKISARNFIYQHFED